MMDHDQTTSPDVLVKAGQSHFSDESLKLFQILILILKMVSTDEVKEVTLGWGQFQDTTLYQVQPATTLRY